MKSNNKEYFLVFDTNVLYQTYDKKADFTSFCFNSTYNNTIEMVNQLDIYEKVTIAIPNVVWSEMTKQIIDAHQSKFIEYEAYIKKWKFPEYSFNKRNIEDFSRYIIEKIAEYKNEISTSINMLINLPLPSDNRFQGIIKRAFDKEPPFGGKEKNSDKGFKDVLIWESILELASAHTNSEIIFYTKDNGFKEKLVAEFKRCNPNVDIYIYSSETDIKSQLEVWAKEIDIFAYQPLVEYEEHKEIIEWLKSADCEIQLIDRDFGIVEKSRIVTSSSVRVISYDNIELQADNDISKEYLLEATLEVTYNFKNEMSIQENIDVYMVVECIDGSLFSIEDIYKSCDEENDDQIGE